MKNVTVWRNLAGGFLFVFAISIMSCGDAANNQDATDNDTTTATMQQHAEAVLTSTYQDTTVTGVVQFDEQPNGQVKMTLNVTVPSHAGKTVAVHIHENGNCGNMGKDVGEHWNPTHAQHGKWSTDSFHLGDIGNIDLNNEGNGSKEMETDRWTIGGDSQTDILNKTIIIHSGKDDFTTQPSGAAGNRIGCGVITKKSS